MKPCPQCNCGLPNNSMVCENCGWRSPPPVAPSPIVVGEPLKTSRLLLGQLGLEGGLILIGGAVGAWVFGAPGFFIGCLIVFVLIVAITLTFS